jgi:hypothetical protein
MVLIMTLSPAQSMEMTAGFELPESGVMIHFTPQTKRSATAQFATVVPEKTPEAYPPTDTRPRIELPESRQMILFSTGDAPMDPAPGSNRCIAKPYVETPAPWGGDFLSPAAYLQNAGELIRADGTSFFSCAMLYQALSLSFNHLSRRRACHCQSVRSRKRWGPTLSR